MIKLAHQDDKNNYDDILKTSSRWESKEMEEWLQGSKPTSDNWGNDWNDKYNQYTQEKIWNL